MNTEKKTLSRHQRLYSSGFKKWPNNEIPYDLGCDYTEYQRGLVAYAFQEVESSSCIKFRPATEDDLDWVGFTKEYDGCYVDATGYGGPGRGRHRLNLQPTGCMYRGVVLHEVMHILGANHEHIRPDRDEHMTVLWPLIPVRV